MERKTYRHTDRIHTCSSRNGGNVGERGRRTGEGVATDVGRGSSDLGGRRRGGLETKVTLVGERPTMVEHIHRGQGDGYRSLINKEQRKE